MLREVGGKGAATGSVVLQESVGIGIRQAWVQIGFVTHHLSKCSEGQGSHL